MALQIALYSTPPQDNAWRAWMELQQMLGSAVEVAKQWLTEGVNLKVAPHHTLFQHKIHLFQLAWLIIR